MLAPSSSSPGEYSFADRVVKVRARAGWAPRGVRRPVKPARAATNPGT
jgi:hypothetical protein